MGERGNSVLFTKKRLFTRLITVKNPDDLAKIQFLTKNTDIIFTHEICGLADVINGVKFIDGVDEETFERQRNAA